MVAPIRHKIPYQGILMLIMECMFCKIKSQIYLSILSYLTF